MTRFTVLIPTHNHADTLWYSVQSVLNQTEQDFEVLIVGDGAPARTAAICEALIERDSRIRYLPYPKGERHGEISRHHALQSATGEFVCYQSDDDLWLPDHLEVMSGLLADHDLAHTMTLAVGVDGDVSTYMYDARIDPAGLERMRRLEAGFGLESGGHTMAAYRRLPHGWRPAPVGMNTDVHFWLQFLDQPNCRYVSHKWPTNLHLSTIPRKAWTLERRMAELSAVAAKASDPDWREATVRGALLKVHDQLFEQAVRAPDAVARAFTVCAVLGVDRTSMADIEPYCLGDELGFGLTAAVQGRAAILPAEALYWSEPWGVWLKALEIALVIPLAAAVERDLILSIELIHMIGTAREKSPVVLAIGHDVILDILEEKPGPQRYEARIPAALTKGARFLGLRLTTSNPSSPAQCGGPEDHRPLSVGLISLTLSPAQGA